MDRAAGQATPQSEQRLREAAGIAQRLTAGIESVLRGKGEELKVVLTALACRGHVLFEDVPGTGKTVLARAIAGCIEDAVFSRVQCTPDLQPSDVTGLAVYNQKTRDFEFRRGPVFANVVLVDEINRAMPKTQSALLEAMAEGQITVDGVTHVLPRPFVVLATENPIEFEGVFPLPEAQLDRFFLKARLGYPPADDELLVIRDQRGGHPLDRLRPALIVADLALLQSAVDDVYVDEMIERWIVDLVRATRQLDQVTIGASVRGSLALERAARAWALLHGRDYVVPEDVLALFAPVLGHRIVLSPAFLAETRGAHRDELLRSLARACLEIAPLPELALEHEEPSRAN
jgi:MoxR-like ATPase